MSDPTAFDRRSRLLWMVAAATGTNHLITEEAMATGMTAGGAYDAVCGAVFLAAPMCALPCRTCPMCRDMTRCPSRQQLRGRGRWRQVRRHSRRVSFAVRLTEHDAL